jgi:hypothetical protein
MSKLSNKIEAHDRSITEVLDDKKYTVDYFQREYKWEDRHIEQLVSDLTSSFLNEYRPEYKRKDIENYNSYYLGPLYSGILYCPPSHPTRQDRSKQWRTQPSPSLPQNPLLRTFWPKYGLTFTNKIRNCFNFKLVADSSGGAGGNRTRVQTWN